jgi:hypothetical protein
MSFQKIRDRHSREADRSRRSQFAASISPGCIGYDGAYFCDEGQHKSGAYCGPICHYRTKSQAPEYQTGGPRSCLAGAGLSEGDFELARMLKLQDRELDALTRELGEKLVARVCRFSRNVRNRVEE